MPGISAWSAEGRLTNVGPITEAGAGLSAFLTGTQRVRQRLDREQSLSLLEFNYMVMQAYDFPRLAQTHGCILPLGASDQWGNIVNGVELARRVDGREVFGLTASLLATASGAKMDKSASGADLHDGALTISAGRKRYVLVRVA